MSTTSILQIFLMFNMFLVGALAVIAAQHAYAHFHPDHDKDHDKPGPDHPLPSHAAPVVPEHLSPAVRQRMIDTAEQHFTETLTRTTVQLERDIADTAERLDKALFKMGSEMASDEMTHYREILQHLRTQGNVGIASLGKAVTEHQAALRQELATQAALTRSQLAGQLDANLADAIAAFLTEALQHEVDLGAQQAYLLKQLDEHKAELIAGVTHDSGAPAEDTETPSDEIDSPKGKSPQVGAEYGG